MRTRDGIELLDDGDGAGAGAEPLSPPPPADGGPGGRPSGALALVLVLLLGTATGFVGVDRWRSVQQLSRDRAEIAVAVTLGEVRWDGDAAVSAGRTALELVVRNLGAEPVELTGASAVSTGAVLEDWSPGPGTTVDPGAEGQVVALDFRLSCRGGTPPPPRVRLRVESADGTTREVEADAPSLSLRWAEQTQWRCSTQPVVVETRYDGGSAVRGNRRIEVPVTLLNPYSQDAEISGLSLLVAGTTTTTEPGLPVVLASGAEQTTRLTVQVEDCAQALVASEYALSVRAHVVGGGPSLDTGAGDMWAADPGLTRDLVRGIDEVCARA